MPARIVHDHNADGINPAAVIRSIRIKKAPGFETCMEDRRDGNELHVLCSPEERRDYLERRFADKWLTGPDDLVPNTEMDFRVPSADEHSAIIDYLKHLGGK